MCNEPFFYFKQNNRMTARNLKRCLYVSFICDFVKSFFSMDNVLAIQRQDFVTAYLKWVLSLMQTSLRV
jgi:hypothetical protein